MSYEHTPQHKVSYEVHELQTTISNLWKMRMTSSTSDYVVLEEGSILSALATLQTLAEDLHVARVNYTRSPSMQAAE